MAKEPIEFFASKEPQSILKHAIFESYLLEWAQITANYFKYLYYVDGFSGPGYYEDGAECSPAIAARVLSQARANSKKKPVTRCWHVEKDQKVFDKLVGDLKNIPQDVQVRPFLGEFHEHLPTILRETTPAHCPVFFFIDPFGFTVHYEDLVAISNAMRDKDGRTHTEVLVNYATAAIHQWLTASNSEDALDRFFGTRTWRDVFREHGFAERPLLALYESQLRKRWSYVFSVEIPKPSMAKTYFHLVFATDSEVAVRIMKHVMFKAKGRGWRQMSLFEEDNFGLFKEWIHETFRGQTLSGRKVIARALADHNYQESDAERAIQELMDEGAVWAYRQGKKKAWDWTLMFDLSQS